ncbi:MAG TPA: MarR family transcriptional regulator [Patescibacteria group bacterium]|nr:MarR family transcriptional regulator [Stellaceae bacterium]HVB35349.1 MarR family transcriptional regulator [Patescibacteria group bacterium]
MKEVKIQSHAGLRKEMKAVATGKMAAPKDAADMSFDSVETLLRLLTPKNRELLAVIRDRKPQSVAELAKMTGRKPPNVLRTLGKLEAVGFIRMKTVNHRKVPTAAVHALRISIDPFSQNDRLELT